MHSPSADKPTLTFDELLEAWEQFPLAQQESLAEMGTAAFDRAVEHVPGESRHDHVAQQKIVVPFQHALNPVGTAADPGHGVIIQLETHPQHLRQRRIILEHQY